MKRFLLVLALAGLCLSGPAMAGGDCCQGGGHKAHVAAAGEKMDCCKDGPAQGIAVLHPTTGSTVSGTVTFRQDGAKVVVTAHLTGLAPNTVHGFHVHEFGDCSAPDATSAGGHYNPEGHPHAGPATETRHAGDLGNVTSDAQGNAHYEITVDNLSVCGKTNPVVGRAVIVHAKADDLKSQPTGDAGARLACGVIGLAKTATP